MNIVESIQPDCECSRLEKSSFFSKSGFLNPWKWRGVFYFTDSGKREYISALPCCPCVASFWRKYSASASDRLNALANIPGAASSLSIGVLENDGHVTWSFFLDIVKKGIILYL